MAAVRAGGGRRRGSRAVFALPLQVGAIRVGVLDLYRDTAGALSPEELSEALTFADAATHAPAGPAGRGHRRGGVLARALAVLDDRAEVHQATGVVSVRAGVGLAEALVLLRARAYAEERPIGDLARDVLDGVVEFGRGTTTMTDRSRGRTRHRVPDNRAEERMAREQRLAEVFVELADTLVEEFDVVDFLQTLTERCVELVDTDAAGLMLDDQRGQPADWSPTPTSPRGCWSSSSCSSDEGPCLDCFATGRVIANIDLATAADRWPVFAAGRARRRLRHRRTRCRCGCGGR